MFFEKWHTDFIEKVDHLSSKIKQENIKIKEASTEFNTYFNEKKNILADIDEKITKHELSVNITSLKQHTKICKRKKKKS